MAEIQMRRSGETQRLFQPLVASLDWLVSKLGWIVGALGVLYLVSGIAFVRENEVALVLRFGRLVGANAEQQIHRPGLLVALPFPIDRVVRVPMELVREVRVLGLDASDEAHRSDPFGKTQGDRIDPEIEGYVITGDRFVMQTRLVARYRVGDAIAFALGGDLDQRERLVRSAVQSAAAKSITQYQSFELAESLRGLPTEIRLRAQATLDDLATGIELVEVTTRGVDYPRQVMDAVIAVTSAAQEAQGMLFRAEQYRDVNLESLRSVRAAFRSDARIYGEALVARMSGAIETYRTLLPQYRAAPDLVRQRLLLRTLGRIFAKDGMNIHLFPPPAPGDRYNELRITMSSRRKSASQDGEGDR